MYVLYIALIATARKNYNDDKSPKLMTFAGNTRITEETSMVSTKPDLNAER